MDFEDRSSQLPVALLIDLTLQPLAGQGIYHYVRQKGDSKTGVLLLKLNGLSGQSRMLIQQRDFDGNLGWMPALSEEIVEESKAEAYIQRAVLRDPDLWVIEIEDRAMANPFDGAGVP